MPANIDMSNGRANIAFSGSRVDIWHRLGQEMKPGMTIDDWAREAGLDWEACKVPALAALEGPSFDHLRDDDPHLRRAADRWFVVRKDTCAVLGGNTVSDMYQVVQPRELLDWFDRYIAVDDRFKLDVAGSLDGGATIWATATFNGDLTVAGERHVARVLMSTTFDGSGATINQGTLTRVVCANTLAMAHADKHAMIRTRHNTRFDPVRVGRELATLAQGFSEFKAMGDAMAQVEMSSEDVSRFFKACLDIPFDAKKEDLSTRKFNQFSDMKRAYRTSVGEGAENGTVWAALQALTRYVDHDRPASKATDEQVMSSTQFGSGAGLKAKGMSLLMPLIKDKIAA